MRAMRRRLNFPEPCSVEVLVNIRIIRKTRKVSLVYWEFYFIDLFLKILRSFLILPSMKRTIFHLIIPTYPTKRLNMISDPIQYKISIIKKIIWK